MTKKEQREKCYFHSQPGEGKFYAADHPISLALDLRAELGIKSTGVPDEEMLAWYEKYQADQKNLCKSAKPSATRQTV